MADDNDTKPETKQLETAADKPTSKADHKFRYLLAPGSNFQFVTKFKTWIAMSILLMCAALGSLFLNKARHGNYMNWTIDFKGGTEIQFSFKDKTTGAYIKPDSGKVREILDKAGEEGFDVSEIDWQDDNDKQVDALIVRTPRFSALTPDAELRAQKALQDKFNADVEITKSNWTGNQLFMKTKKRIITNEEAAPVFVATDPSLELKPWSAKELDGYKKADEDSKEFSEVFSMWGVDRQFKKTLEAGLPNTEVTPVQSYGVGAKAGDKLRDDAAKSIIYAIFLIMLYLAFRFDIRYAPGAAFATIHDAVMVIGVFAITWTEVSLTSVAGLLTVMGYSVNDTVIVFDRIRENQAKLKDKKIEKIIDVSINEMLARTILTSSTVFATTLVMNIFGTGLVKNFAFAMNIGVIVGTYSSIFLAAPIFMYISKKWYSGPVPARRRAAPVQAATVKADTKAIADKSDDSDDATSSDE